MEQINFWKDLIVSGGQIGGLVFVVVVFLKHLARRDERFESISDKLWDVLSKNTETINRNTISNERLTGEISQLRQELKK